jgi:hypothetical protein
LDFNIWSDHRFAETAMWSSADFNADGFTDGRDFNIWNRQAFTASDHDRARSPGGVAERVPRAPLGDNVQAAPQMAATDTQSISKIERPTDFDASKAISTDTIWRNRFRHDALPSKPSLHQSMTDNAQVRLIDDVLGQW